MDWLRHLLRTLVLVITIVVTSPVVLASELLLEPSCLSVADGSPATDFAADTASGHCGHHCPNCLLIKSWHEPALESAGIVEPVGSRLLEGLTVSPPLLPPIV